MSDPDVMMPILPVVRYVRIERCETCKHWGSEKDIQIPHIPDSADNGDPRFCNKIYHFQVLKEFPPFKREQASLPADQQAMKLVQIGRAHV